MKPSVKPLCPQIKTTATDISRSDGLGISNCCTSDRMDGMEDEEDAGNAGSEQ
jgi:hypothetical protein